MCVKHSAPVDVRGQLAGVGSASTLWILGIKLKSLCLVASVFLNLLGRLAGHDQDFLVAHSTV